MFPPAEDESTTAKEATNEAAAANVNEANDEGEPKVDVKGEHTETTSEADKAESKDAKTKDAVVDEATEQDKKEDETETATKPLEAMADTELGTTGPGDAAKV